MMRDASPLHRSVTDSLRMMRITWTVMLMVALTYLVCPLLWGYMVARGDWPSKHPEALGPGGLWCAGAGFPGASYRWAALLVIASAILPWALHRRSIARLRRRAVAEIDPSRPGDYRNAPGTQPHFADPGRAQRSAATRYVARLALSFALVAPLPFLAGAHMGWFVPFTSCVVVTQCYVDPMEYAPLILLAAVVIAVQCPTRRRALRAIDDLRAAPGGPSAP